METNNKFLYIYAKTWNKENKGLFDYRSKNTKNVTSIISRPTYFSRQSNDFLNPEIILFNIENDLIDHYSLSSYIKTNLSPTKENLENLNDKIYYVINQENSLNKNENNYINCNKNSDYYLNENDIIKIGKEKFNVNEINISVNNKNNFNNEDQIENNYNISFLNKHIPPIFNLVFKENSNNFIENKENLCKICYSDENNSENPLLHLCKCKGDLEYSHYNCIKKFLSTKLNIIQNKKQTVISYYINSFNCEICKTPYPLTIKLKNKIYNLIDIRKPKNDYMILESLNQIKENNNHKSIHIISLKNDEPIFIGRGSKVDIKLNEETVSRMHCLLKYDINNGRILIKDLNSTFGTLVLIKTKLEIINKIIMLQTGRTVIQACVIDKDKFEKFKLLENNKNNQKEEA